MIRLGVLHADFHNDTMQIESLELQLADAEPSKIWIWLHAGESGSTSLPSSPDLSEGRFEHLYWRKTLHYLTLQCPGGSSG